MGPGGLEPLPCGLNLQSSCRIRTTFSPQLTDYYLTPFERMKLVSFNLNNQLERIVGIEPTSPGWKPEIIPLYDTRILIKPICQ